MLRVLLNRIYGIALKPYLRSLRFALKPFLRWLGYRRAVVQSLLPESHYYLGRSGFGDLANLHHHFLRSSGWLESVNSNSRFFQGDHRPWLTFPAIHFLDTMNLAQATVLELGGGASTIFFSKRARRVITFEFDHDWGKTLGDAFHDRATVEIIEPAIQSGLLMDWSQSKNPNPLCKFSDDVEFDSDAFVGLIREKLSESDLVLIDGGPRNLAMVAASRFAKPSAIVIVDNSDWAGLTQGIDALRKEGFREIPMRGLGPLNHYEWTTSYFIRDLNSVCLTN